MRRTAATNMAMVAASSIAGVLIARDLGASGRGDYAAVAVWFGTALVVGELGLTAAITYYVASDPKRAREYIATGRLMMVASGSLCAAAGYAIAPLIGDNPAVVTCMRLMFCICIPAFVGAPFGFALQAMDLRKWNLMRISQPVPFLVWVLMLALADRMSLLSVCIGLAVTSVAQSVLSFWLCRASGLAGGDATRALVRPLGTYGVSQLAATAPTAVNARLDQLVLSQVAGSRVLGLYAVAVSVVSLSLPLVTAVGNVTFPRLARSTQDHGQNERLQRRATLLSVVLGVSTVAPLCIVAPVLVPVLFGHEFQSAVFLVWILAPGAVALACSTVSGDVLRGLGRPMVVARAQLSGAALTIVALALLVPPWGARGAALASSLTYLATLALLLMAQRDGKPVGTPNSALKHQGP